jgi:geranylgeranyl transferase type-2 subunit alpha
MSPGVTRYIQKREGDHSAEAFGRTTELLDQNPEFYTVWNYRREIFINGLFRSS